ncbi:MFS transporter [Actinokineospora spheciospongiae]|uniref:MFS transporter n=1 Tax=Actinokineospora spheciospongiae TaxID=909613 RepID=UPI000D710249|nr:MFS transporter [Actinokineospora spheciospongiae]PWW61820.1 sugar phosphate permease [Actinokineospora spheciospongiae]
MTETADRTRRRWLVLAVAVAGQAATSTLVYGLPFLIPALRAAEGLDLAQAGGITVAPVLGVLVALIAWGAAADRFGERVVMTIGMTGTGVGALAAALLPGIPALAASLVVAGVFSASISAASGRAVLGWFGPTERGLAMGIRQTCQPIGVGIAALALPPAAGAFGYRAALLVPAALCLVCAVLVALALLDPPRQPAKSVAATRSPYRGGRLVRVHLASALLVVPQFVAGTFALTYLVSEQDWSPVAAGALLAAVQALGAAGRIGAGVWSDRVASRMRPMRTIAAGAALALVLWAVGDQVAPWLAAVGLVATMVISVTDNGLGFTATAELAGPFWAGRALGIQNTGQNAVALAVAPVFGALVPTAGWVWALLIAAVVPVAAMALTPVKGEEIG